MRLGNDQVPSWHSVVDSPQSDGQSPEHFGTICKGEAHELDEGRIIPSCSIWLNSASLPLVYLQRGGESVRTQEYLWFQCDELLSTLTCSQENSNLLTLGKSVIGFGMGLIGGGNKKYRADR